MPSSTSNSSVRAPTAPWVRIWLTSVVLFALIMGGAESFWRTRGLTANVIDNMALWSSLRHQVYAPGAGKPAVLVGASRMQFGFSHKTFAAMQPEYPLVNLSIAGSCPLAILRDLAGDADFNGTVLIDITENCFFTFAHEEQQAYVDHAREGNLNRAANARLRSLVQERLVSIDPDIRLIRLVKRALRGKPLPESNYYSMSSEREIVADYAKTDADEHRKERVNKMKFYVSDVPPMHPTDWLQQALLTEAWVQQIQARGGDVVFIRFPSSGEHWLLDNSWYPKAEYWDRFAARSSAHTLHFVDVPGMAAFDLPDNSHLNQPDRPAFTRLLVEALQEQGMFRD